MPEITLVADTGRVLGSRSSRRLRRTGKVPAVLYGHGTEPRSVSVDVRELRHALSGPAGANALLSVELDGSKHLAMVKDLQRDGLKGTAVHVDFVVVGRHELIDVDVPLVLIGEAVEVGRAGGTVDQEAFSLRLRVAADQIPPSVEIDISGLGIGDTIRLEDIKLPPGTEADSEGDLVLVVAHSPSAGGEERTESEGAGEPAEPEA